MMKADHDRMIDGRMMGGKNSFIILPSIILSFARQQPFCHAALNVLCHGFSAIDQPGFGSYSFHGRMDFEFYATRFILG
jgi:hypothetical protein